MAGRLRAILRLLRVKQYYKNVLIFVGAFFGRMLLDFSLWLILIFGFILACCASSINYIVNDLVDIEKDRAHPEKSKKRPLASGELSKSFAYLLLIILIAFEVISLVFILPFPTNLNFGLMLLAIAILGQSYNFFLKEYAFIDIISLSIIYIIRAIAGCFLIQVYISPWLILAIFLVALFLVICKRTADLELIGEEDASKHKKVYDQYSKKLLEDFHLLVSSSLFVVYSLYIILGAFDVADLEAWSYYQYLSIFTIPLALYLIMRYMYLLKTKPEIARSPVRIFLDKGMITIGIIIVVMLFIAFYWETMLSIFGLT